MFDTMYSNITN